MDSDWWQRNWALAAGLVLLAPALFVALRALLAHSAWGQLRRASLRAGRARREYRRLEARRRHCARRVQALGEQAERVKPRHLQEAVDALGDAEALLKIADDQILINDNHLRKVILEEYPPSRQAALRRRYLPQDRDDDRPFSF